MSTRRPTWIEIDLASLPTDRAVPLEALRRTFASSDPSLEDLGSASGEALALALLAERTDRPFAIAVGDAVRRGLPSAARASIVAHSPLSGLVVDGQVGSDLGPRLASVADAVLLVDRARCETSVLVLGAESVELCALRELAGLSPHDTHLALEARFGEVATLAIGAAGERGLPIANLAARSSSSSVAHFVGRGGLGAALGLAGLKAVAVRAPIRAVQPEAELVRALLASPRLAARSRGATFELADGFAARGALFADGGSRAIGREVARAFVDQVAALSRASHGCRGCPTPCGLVFGGAESDGGAGEPRGARFSAVHALGFQLGLERADDALRLLAACDRFGLDAKELGAALALIASPAGRARCSGAPQFGDVEAFDALISDAAAERGLGVLVARGADRVASALGLVAYTARGQCVRPEANLASLLGQCVAARGADPMRSFAFSAVDLGSRQSAERLLAPLELEPGAFDPLDPACKGRLVWWHENFAAALDVSGFCSFSAGALLADGVCTLADLSRWLFASPRDPLHFGARIVSLVRELHRRVDARGELDRPSWAREALDRPGMWDEYRALRGLDQQGHEDRERALWRDAEPNAARSVPRAMTPSARAADPAMSGDRAANRGAGRVRVESSATLAQLLGASLDLECEFPLDVAGLLELLARRSPAHRSALFDRRAIVPAVFREGRRLEPSALVAPGDRLDLVIAISGG